MKDGTPADRVTWELLKMAFKGKYVKASYMDARRKEFLNLVQGGKNFETIFGGIQELRVVQVGMLKEQEWKSQFEQFR